MPKLEDMPFARLLLIMVLLLSLPAFAQKGDGLLSDHFSGKVNVKEKRLLQGGFTSKQRSTKRDNKSSFLPDFYGKLVEEVAERNQLPSFFNRAIQREKERTQQPDFFQKGIFNKERSMQADHFLSRVIGRKRGMQSDHFSSAISQKERGQQPDHFGSAGSSERRSDAELEMSARKKRLWRKNFIGERFRLFNKKPNQKQERKKRKAAKKRDPFGKDAREMDTPQSPKNQMDLFNGGVLPKMKDLR
jgi:hypothetical protein